MSWFNARLWPSTLGRIFCVAAVYAALPAAGCGAGVAECTLDADCDQSFACELSECVAVCNADSDCDDDEVCLRGLTTERRVCQVPDGTNVAVRSLFALVRDTTDGDGCLSADPGADVAFVLLEDLDGDVVAWGRLAQSTIIELNNDYSSAAHINGAAPSWGADSCPDFQPDRIASLGCGGAVAVDFVDATGAVIDVRSGEHRLRVGEFGEQCDGGNELDRYEVLLCPGVENMDELPEPCTVSVGVGQGERAFDI